MNTCESKLTFGKLIRMEFGVPIYSLAQYFGTERLEEMLRSILIPCGLFAESLPCPTYNEKTCTQRCPRKIMYYAEQKKYAAYCHEFLVKDFYVSEDDLRMFKTNIPRLVKACAAVLNIQGEPEFLSNGRTWVLGEVASSASKRHPVFLEASTIQTVIGSDLQSLLLYEIQKPTLIFTVGKFVPEAALARLIRSKHCMITDIDDFIKVQQNCELSCRNNPGNPLSDFIAEAKIEMDAAPGFDFPKGKTWENLYIHILDGDTVTFDINGSISKHTRKEMGLGDALWEMLKVLAAKYGRIPNGEIRASSGQKKRLQRLNDALAAYCHSSTKPIELTADGSEYVCRCKLKPEWHNTSHHPSKRSK